jgi:hypothetical protein
MASRKAIKKSVRFDVFKRDSFKCQYCGASAPDVILVIDHIKPVAKGGKNDIANLITACQPCNAGKSDKVLCENASLSKARSQLEELQERREQLEMMMAWMEGLRELNDSTVKGLIEYWEGYIPGSKVSPVGRIEIKKLARKFDIKEIYNAMDIAAENYLKRKDSGDVTPQLANEAFSKIRTICNIKRADKDNPELKDLYYIRAIMRNKTKERGGYFCGYEAMSVLRAARAGGVELSKLLEIAKRERTWWHFNEKVNSLLVRGEDK